MLFLVALHLPKVSQSNNKEQCRRIKKQEKKYLKQGWHTPPYTTMAKELSRLKYYQKSPNEGKFVLGKGIYEGTDFFYVRDQAQLEAKLDISRKINNHINSLTKTVLKVSTKEKKTLSHEEITNIISINTKNALKKENLQKVFEAYRINKAGKIEIKIYLVYPILNSDELIFRNLAPVLNNKELFRALMNVNN